MTEDVKMSDQLEQWYNEHPDEWIQGQYVKKIDNRLCYCIVGKCASLLGVRTISDSNGNLRMNPFELWSALDTYAKGFNMYSFPSAVYEVNDQEGFEPALEVLRNAGL